MSREFSKYLRYDEQLVSCAIIDDWISFIDAHVTLAAPWATPTFPRPASPVENRRTRIIQTNKQTGRHVQTNHFTDNNKLVECPARHQTLKQGRLVGNETVSSSDSLATLTLTGRRPPSPFQPQLQPRFRLEYSEFLTVKPCNSKHT